MSIAHSGTTRQLGRRLASEGSLALSGWQRSPLWLCLLVALAARLWLIYQGRGLVSGDEALVGIAALRVLKGEHPIYIYGQPAMGGLTVYLLAPFLAIFGATVWALRAGSVLLSLVLVCQTWLLARALAENARLEPRARRRFQTIAALLAALPPLYDGVVEMRVWGGYSETLVFSLLILYCTVRLAQRWSQGIGLGESTWRWLGLGLAIGIGYWVNPLIELPIQIAAIWLIGAAIGSLIAIWRDDGASQEQEQGSKRSVGALVRSWLMAIYAVGGVLIGFAPALYWGYRNHWQNIKYILSPEKDPIIQNAYMSADYVASVGQVQEMTRNYLTCDASRTLSGLLPNTPVQRSSVFAQLLHPQTQALLAYDGVLIFMGGCSVVAIGLFLLSYVIKRISFARKLLTLPLLFCTGVSTTFCLTNIVTLYQTQYTCDADRTGQYAALLMLVLPFVVAAVLTVMSGGNREQSTPAGSGEAGPRVDGSRPRTNMVTRGILLIVILLYLGVQGTIYATTPGESVFRSQLCKITLVHTDQVITYLKQEQIHELWSDSQVGNVLTFKTSASVVAADPRIFTNFFPDLLPDYANTVNAAKHASVAFLLASTDNLARKLMILDAEHFKYTMARFTVDQGMDLAVVTPMDDTLQLADARTLIAGEPAC